QRSTQSFYLTVSKSHLHCNTDWLPIKHIDERLKSFFSRREPAIHLSICFELASESPIVGRNSFTLCDTGDAFEPHSCHHRDRCDSDQQQDKNNNCGSRRHGSNEKEISHGRV